MKIILKILLLTPVLFTLTPGYAQDGEQLFKSNCASCHSIGKGKLVGPDLKDAHSRYDEQWLLKWVKSSQSLVKAGDEVAVKLYNDNNKVPMPDAFINEDQIKSVISFIKTKSSESVQTAAPVPAGQVAVATADQNTSQNLLNMFSTAEYFMIGLIALLLLIVWVLAKTIKSLSIALERKFNSEDFL